MKMFPRCRIGNHQEDPGVPRLLINGEFHCWLGLLEPGQSEIFVTLHELEAAVKKAKAEAYRDAAATVHHGFSFASIWGILMKKAKELDP